MTLSPVGALFRVGCISLATASVRALPAQQPRARPLTVVPAPVNLELSAIRWAFSDEKGNLIFADDKARLVYVRDKSGRVRQLGRHGEGPGEYRFPTNGYLKGDTVLIHEVGLGRREAINLTSGGGNSIRFTGTPVGLECRVLVLLDDSGLCEETEIGEHGSGTNTLTSKWFRVDQSGHAMRVIQVAYDSSYVARVVHSTGVLHIPRPYTWATRSSVSPGATFAVVLDQSTVAAGSAVTVEMWSLRNGTRRKMGHVARVIEVSASARVGMVARVIAELGQGRPQLLAQRGAFEGALRRGWHLGAMAPPYNGILVSDDRCVWLERTDVGWPTWNPMKVYDRWTFEGRRLPSVSLDRRVRITAVRCDAGVGVQANEVGIPRLVHLSVPQ